MELIKKRLSNSIIRSMRHKNIYHRSHNTIIDIFIDMLIQFEMKRGASGDINNEVLTALKEDVIEYADSLNIHKAELHAIFRDIQQQIKLENNAI